jgi:pimeloyl-ACP methyl ester carboxylesterase
MTHLQRLLAGGGNCILIGSSYGGLMATVYACRETERVKKLILLAPALTLPELDPYRTRRLSVPTLLYHGRRDDVVPPETVRTIAEAMFAHLDYHLVEDDHNLHDTFRRLDWPALLELPPALMP